MSSTAAIHAITHVDVIIVRFLREWFAGGGAQTIASDSFIISLAS